VSIASARPRRRPGQWGKWIGIAIPHAVLSILGFLALYPFVWLFFGTFKPYKELMQSKSFFPIVWTLKNYQEIITRSGFVRAFATTAYVAGVVTIVCVLTSTAVGFVFSKYRFPGRDLLFTIILSTMMVPGAVTMVPLYITIANFGWVDQLAGIMVGGFWSTFGIFMLRQFMESVPNELIDAARIDGASEPRIFLQLMVPNSTAPMSALALFVFLGNWDSYVWPSIVLTSPEKQTIPLLLNGLRSIYWTRYELWTAGAMLTIVPVMTVYAFVSRYMIKGVAMTGMKF